jgi:hypothetical protein
VLDRNGLRPSRYVVTKDGFVVMASEVGVLEIEPSNIVVKERLHPGRSSSSTSSRADRRRRGDQAALRRAPARTATGSSATGWSSATCPRPRCRSELRNREQLLTLQQAFGYTMEDLKVLIAPMAVSGKWAIGSMGEDAALACLSDRPQLLYRYFKQRFAQVSNPAMDSINERPVMALFSTLGAERNLLEESEEHARMIRSSIR